MKFTSFKESKPSGYSSQYPSKPRFNFREQNSRSPHARKTRTNNNNNPAQALEKYMSLARDAVSCGDWVAAEGFYQHADHYQRLISSSQEGLESAPKESPPPLTETQKPCSRAKENDTLKPNDILKEKRTRKVYPLPKNPD